MEPKLFNKAKNTNAEEFKKFLPVNVQFRYETFAPTLALAEQNFIIPILGQKLFDELVGFYNDTIEDEDVQKLLELVQFAEVRLAYWKGYHTLSVMITDAGATREISNERALYRYQEDNLLNELKNDGFDQLDVVIAYLEENMDMFPEFEESEYFPKIKNSFITNTKTFNDLYNINNSRLVFLKMKYHIEDVEQITLPHYIGRKFMGTILKDIQSVTYTPILRQIQKFVVYMALHNGVAELQKFPTEKGLIFESANNDGKQERPVTTKELERTREHLKQQADAYKSAFVHYLNANKKNYPEYEEFIGKTHTTSDRINRPSTSKTFFT